MSNNIGFDQDAKQIPQIFILVTELLAYEWYDDLHFRGIWSDWENCLGSNFTFKFQLKIPKDEDFEEALNDKVNQGNYGLTGIRMQCRDVRGTESGK